MQLASEIVVEAIEREERRIGKENAQAVIASAIGECRVRAENIE